MDSRKWGNIHCKETGKLKINKRTRFGYDHGVQQKCWSRLLTLRFTGVTGWSLVSTTKASGSENSDFYFCFIFKAETCSLTSFSKPYSHFHYFYLSEWQIFFLINKTPGKFRKFKDLTRNLAFKDLSYRKRKVWEVWMRWQNVGL